MARVSRGTEREWQESGRVLLQRAAVLAEVGAVLEGWGAGTQAELADRMERSIGRALAGRGGTRGPAEERQHPAQDGRQSLRALAGQDLSGGHWPVVWLASDRSGTATLAVALGSDGDRRVVGLWSGGQAQVRMAQTIALDLRQRGLNRGEGWLAITECGRALEQALREQWGGALWVGHDQAGVRRTVLAHLPTPERTAADDAMRQAWDVPGVVSARQALGELSDRWADRYPGASERLAKEIEATTMVQELGVHGALTLRLRSVAPAGYLLEHGLAFARGCTGSARLEAVAGELLRRQEHFRHLPAAERGGLEALVQKLQGTGV